MVEKMTSGPNAPIDRPKAFTVREKARETLDEKIKAKVAGGEVNAQQARIAHIYLLGDQHLLRDEGELQDLLACSQREIKEANRIATEAISAGDDLGKFIQNIRAAMSAPESTAPQNLGPDSGETTEAQLTRLAKMSFTTNSQTLSNNELRAQEKLARWAAVYIAQRSLKKSTEEIALIVKVKPSTVPSMLKEAREEYAAKDSFYNKIQVICKKLGVAAP